MSSKQASILVVDDERSVTDLLSAGLEEEGYTCFTAPSGEDALRRLSKDNTNVVLLDLRLPGISGMDVLREIASAYPEVAVIVITAAVSAETAVEAMKIGAVDYITKPFELEKVNCSIEAALQASRVWGSAAQGDDAEMEEEVDWARYLDDIAHGVEIRLGALTSEAMTVIQRTVTTARSLEIPEDQIGKWVNARQKRNDRWLNYLGPLTEKVAKSAVA